MESLNDLLAQYERLQEAIAQTPPEFCAGLHYASGLLLADIKAHSDVLMPLRASCLFLPQEFTPPGQCSFCTRPANPDLPTADWPMCSVCYNELGSFDPVLDGAALEIAEGMLP
jgi:hypothetical protein